jgi:hypothetical protein
VVTSKQRKSPTRTEILAFTDPSRLVPDLPQRECRFGTRVIAILKLHKSGAPVGRMPEGVFTTRSPRSNVLYLSYCEPFPSFTSAFFTMSAGQMQHDAYGMGYDATHPILFGKNTENISFSTGTLAQMF